MDTIRMRQLQLYCDGSRNPQYVTLAGLGAEESTWAYLDKEWRDILRNRGGAAYMHMNEAFQHRGPFQGWSDDQINHLIFGLLGLLKEVNHYYRFSGFRCTIDLAAHKTARSINSNVPSVERICAALVFYRAFTWYSEFTDAIITPMDIFFDRGEPYLDQLKQYWRTTEIPYWCEPAKIANPAKFWDFIGRLESSNKTVPAIQAADMLAWSYNRLKTDGCDGWAGRTATAIVSGIDCWQWDLGEREFNERRFPNEGGFFY